MVRAVIIHNYTCINATINIVLTETKEEILVYDWIRFLSAVGGSMGLFLGSSALSILLSGINIVEKRIKRAEKKNKKSVEDQKLWIVNKEKYFATISNAKNAEN